MKTPRLSQDKSLGFIVTVCYLGLSTTPALSNDSEDLFSLSLKELGDIEITSISKRDEIASEAAAAIHVITQEDIKRSGATSIPEALRLAPGVNVARSGSGQWAVSIRGFNAQFSNKLLVLIDGRSVYTPMFSGVFWSVQDTMMEDIKRIEIVRGPGGTIWGANAVNGVINIITKEAKDSQGALAVYQHGLQEQNTSIRYGGEINKNTHYRAFAKQKHNRNYQLSSGVGADDKWDMWRAGMRVDSNELSYGDLSIQSEFYQGRENSDFFLPNLTGPRTEVDDAFDTLGGHLQAQWSYLEGSNEYSIKSYYDITKRDTFIFEDTTQTVDIDFNHSFKAAQSHDMIWGLGYRLINSDIEGTDILSFSPANRTDNLFSAFLQDKITLLEDVKLTLGSKFEYNDYTEFEWQPSARLGWKIDDTNYAWASFTRAIRTPGRTGHGVNIAVGALPTPAGITLVQQIGNEATDSEKLYAYEFGYRTQPLDELSLDVTAFYHDYTTLGSDSLGTPFLATNPTFGSHVVLPLVIGSDSTAETFGIEVSADWKTTPHWLLSASYSALEMDVNGGSTFVSGEGLSPNHQVNLESHYTPDENWEFDTLLYYVDELNPTATTVIDDYWRLDARLAYNLDNGVSLSLVGQNLLEDQKPEFSSFVYNRQIEVPRTVYGKVNWKF
ncbi:MAG: TonB-dependent receptor [Rickettsiales bacterium]|nr:TonB-dependent receptor [Rickettsiales bacterium]